MTKRPLRQTESSQSRRKSDAARRANQVIRGRTLLLMGVLGIVTFSLLFWRLWDLQINRHVKCRTVR